MSYDTLNTRLTRRNLVKLSLGGVTAGLLTPARPLFAQSREVVRWISPRGSIEVIDDYPYWLAVEFSYFGDMETTMEAGPIEAASNIKFVAQGQGDVAYPSPGVFSLGVESGIDLVGVFNQAPVDVFNFAFRKGERPNDLKALEGKTILVGSAGWKAIADPLLFQVGVDVSSINYVAVGGSWGQALAQGQGDAALSWEGLRALWFGQGLDFDWFLGRTFSKLPSNTFVIRREDYEDVSKRDLYERYLRGWAAGMEFGHLFPVKACQFTMDKIPALRGQMEPEVAVDSLLQGDNAYSGDLSKRRWGEHDIDAWQTFLDIALELGQITNPIRALDIVSNDLIAGANKFNSNQIESDAASIQLRDEYANIDLDAIRARL